MGTLRSFLGDHRRLAALLFVLALSMKALVPSGFMIGATTKFLTVEICAGSSGDHLTKQIAIPRGGKTGEGQSGDSKADSACPYSALSMASLSGADGPLIALALVFIIALGFAPVRPASIARIPYLRPPLRGPPAIA